MRPAIAERLEEAGKLEKAQDAGPVYARLCVDAAQDAAAVLEVAARRHPAASWLLDLAERHETVPGTLQLRGASTHASFQVVAWACAARGFVDALVEEGALGRPETAAALLAHGHPSAAVESAARALAANPDCQVVPWLAAVEGPAAEAVIARIVPRVRSRAAAASLERQLTPFPMTRRLVRAALAGLA